MEWFDADAGLGYWALLIDGETVCSITGYPYNEKAAVTGNYTGFDVFIYDGNNTSETYYKNTNITDVKREVWQAYGG